MGTGLASGLGGNNIIGNNYFSLGPAYLHYGEDIADVSNLTGTVSVTAASTAITGVGTAFTTDFAVGDWIAIAGLATDLQIQTITSNTAMVAMLPAASTVATATFKKVDQIDLGDTMNITLTISQKKTDLKSIQRGDNRADASWTGYEVMVKTELTSATVERLVAVNRGYQAVRDSVTGLVKGFGFGFRGYELDSQIWKPLFVKLQSGGVVTSVALEKMKFLRAVPMQDGDVAYSAADQRNVAVAFNCYLDETTLINSVPQLFTVGDVTP